MDTNNYNYYEEDDEISLLNLIGYVFRHLKKMLIVSIVVALVLGGLLGYKKSRIYKDQYLDNLDTYMTSVNELERELGLLINTLNDYVEDNAFFELNTNNCHQARALYFIKTDYKIIPNSDYQNPNYTDTIINAYITELTSGDVLNKIAKKYNINSSFIKDYYSIYIHDSLIDINVFNSDEEIATGILHDLENVLYSFNDKISNAIVENEISKVLETVYHGINSDIVANQYNKLSFLNEYIDNLKNTKEQIVNLEKPTKNENFFIKSSVKYSVGCFVAIFFVMCIYYTFVFMLSGKVYSAEEFKNKTNIIVIGNLTYLKKYSKYIKWINKLEKRVVSNDYGLLVSNIKAYCNNSKKILLSGNIEEGIKEDIVSNLKMQLKDAEIMIGGSLLTDSIAVDELNNVNHVILLVKCNETLYKDIKQEIDKLYDLKVKNVYAIVVD